MSTRSAVPLDEFRASNWEAFTQFENQFQRSLTQYSRTLPPKFYKTIRHGLSAAFGEGLNPEGQGPLASSFRFKVVIDSNIIVQDSLAVAAGKPSSTGRILSSPFVSVLAPRSIKEESERNIRSRAKRKGLPVDVALAHARSLLTRIRLISAEEEPSIKRAREAIGAHSPEDIPFLAVAIESSAVAVVSRDKAAFDNQAITQRWDLKDLVRSVVTYESGALSVVVVGTGASVLLRALQAIVVVIARATLELLSLALSALGALVKGAIQALGSVPAWGWGLIAAILIGVGIYAARHPEVGQRIGEGIAVLGQAIQRLGAAIVEAAATFLEALHNLLVWLWNTLLPVTAAGVVVAGVLLKRVRALILEANRLRGLVPAA